MKSPFICVKISPPEAKSHSDARQIRANMKSFLEIYTLANQSVHQVLQADTLIEAPNWEPSG